MVSGTYVLSDTINSSLRTLFAVVYGNSGAALGIPVGVGLAALFDRALHNIPFSLPWGTIVVFVLAAILVGLIAAVSPARRASRLNILNALQYE
jgi:putative ABC transport system permease protein